MICFTNYKILTCWIFLCCRRNIQVDCQHSPPWFPADQSWHVPPRLHHRRWTGSLSATPASRSRRSYRLTPQTGVLGDRKQKSRKNVFVQSHLHKRWEFPAWRRQDKGCEEERNLPPTPGPWFAKIYKKQCKSEPHFNRLNFIHLMSKTSVSSSMSSMCSKALELTLLSS